MNKKVLLSLILAVFVSLLATSLTADFFTKREMALQKDQYKSKGVVFGEILVPAGVPFPYGCAGLCRHEINTKNLLKDLAIFYVPSYILVYFLLEVITRRRARFASK